MDPLIGPNSRLNLFVTFYIDKNFHGRYGTHPEIMTKTLIRISPLVWDLPGRRRHLHWNQTQDILHVIDSFINSGL